MSRPPHLLPPAGEEPERSPLGDIRSHPVPCRSCCRRLTWNHSATCAACRRKAAEDQ